MFEGRLVIFQLSLLLKMRVFTVSKNTSRRQSAHLSNQIQQNIDQLASLITPNTHSQKELVTQNDNQSESIRLAQELVASLHEPCQAMLLYPLVVDFPVQHSPDPLFLLTSYPP